MENDWLNFYGALLFISVVAFDGLSLTAVDLNLENSEWTNLPFGSAIFLIGEIADLDVNYVGVFENYYLSFIACKAYYETYKLLCFVPFLYIDGLSWTELPAWFNFATSDLCYS